jgi:hypothetical protein
MTDAVQVKAYFIKLILSNGASAYRSIISANDSDARENACNSSALPVDRAVIISSMALS